MQKKDFGDWTLIWMPVPEYSADEIQEYKYQPSISDLRQIARRAGVHLFSESNDAFYAGNGLVTLHANEGGLKTLRFPQTVRLSEVLSKKPIDVTGDIINFEMKKNETRCFNVETR